MFTLRNAIGMRLEDIQEEKKHLREMIKQLTDEQHELIARLERMERNGEGLTDTEDDLKSVEADIPASLSIDETEETLKNDYILPTDPIAFSADRSKTMTYKELTHILINYAKEHHNQVDHEAFEQFLIDQYNFTPANFSHIIWRARKMDRRLRSLISGNRKITILDNESD
ncbi:hypothetical protein GCM10010954_28460 [Halobacillus andaensis]|uniref:Uncharacterized protein n=1 Tax=Halobacillus andaensis TaxID=1176239 RepID=A0A917EZ64_HALAA|nr:hypothetical protein [Halobacillus andaensis]MBP2006478.1 effector-binding domain-containing protein [Halobacillus andaensis]GGF27661.1 hypothetical protein GCM10010954_28460 [Halobacillus andaensis]